MTSGSTRPSILFCGKHRVNFAMYAPVYQYLRDQNEADLYLSTGRYRRKPIVGWLDPHDPEFLNANIFGEFGVDPAHLLKTSHKDQRAYDLYVTSNMDSKMRPPNSRTSVQIFHGVSFRNFAVRRDYVTQFDKLFFPGRYMKEQYVARGYLEDDDPKGEVMGMPKLDRLVDGSLDREVILKGLGLDPAMPTVLWCPTGARHNSFEKLGAKGIAAIEATGSNLILKLHDHPHLPKGQTRGEIIESARSAVGANSRVLDNNDIAPLLVAADLLVTDASSVAFECCLLDRPIVFVDVPELLAHRSSMEDSAMDTETHGRNVGRIAEGAEALTAIIREELGNPGGLSAERRAAAEHIFYKPGTATERMAGRLLEIARHS